MVDVCIVTETSQEANWNRQADRQADRRTGGQADTQDHVLSQADTLTKNQLARLRPGKDKQAMCQTKPVETKSILNPTPRGEGDQNFLRVLDLVRG